MVSVTLRTHYIICLWNHIKYFAQIHIFLNGHVLFLNGTYICRMSCFALHTCTKDQAPVVQRLDNAIHRINHYPADSVVCFVNTYPLDSVIRPLNNRALSIFFSQLCSLFIFSSTYMLFASWEVCIVKNCDWSLFFFNSDKYLQH